MEVTDVLETVWSKTTVYEQSLAALMTSTTDELKAAKDRLATPAETEPLQQRLAALKAMRPRL